MDAGEAARKGVSVAQYAAEHRRHLEERPGRVGPGTRAHRQLRAAADVAIYTPGAETGLPLSVLRSFSPPLA